jgi:hypothetical protein
MFSNSFLCGQPAANAAAANAAAANAAAANTAAANTTGLPLRRRPMSSAASTSLTCLLHLHLTSAIIISHCISPVQAEHLSFSLLNLFSLKINFLFLSSKYAVEACDLTMNC